jgi:hypothetical protein
MPSPVPRRPPAPAGPVVRLSSGARRLGGAAGGLGQGKGEDLHPRLPRSWLGARPAGAGARGRAQERAREPLPGPLSTQRLGRLGRLLLHLDDLQGQRPVRARGNSRWCARGSGGGRPSSRSPLPASGSRWSRARVPSRRWRRLGSGSRCHFPAVIPIFQRPFDGDLGRGLQGASSTTSPRRAPGEQSGRPGTTKDCCDNVSEPAPAPGRRPRSGPQTRGCPGRGRRA